MKRRGFAGLSLAELTLFAAIGLVLFGILMGLLSRIWRHDEHSAGRIDAVSTLASTLAHLCEDQWLCRRVAPQQGALAFERLGSTEAVRYSWAGAGQALRRAGRVIGARPVAAFTVGVAGGAALLALSIGTDPVATPHARRISVALPLAAPDQGLRRQFTYWGPPPAAGAPDVPETNGE